MKRAVLFVSVAMFAGVLGVSSAYAEAPELPAAPNIVDDQGDAQTNSSQGDLWHAWFTESESLLNVHFNNAAPPPPTPYGTEWRIYASPDADGNDCLLIRAQVPAGSYVGEPIARIFDVCEVGDSWFNDSVAEAPVEFGEMADGSGYIQTSFEKSALPYINDGATIASPRAQAHFLIGAQEEGFFAPLVDDTEVGTDYKVGGGDSEVAKPPKNKGKKDKAPVKKGCKKNKDKGKKKGCKKGKGPKDEPKAGCEAYVPGEQGAEAETVVVTDEHTEEAPLELTIQQGMGLGGPLIAGVPPDQTSRFYSNLQVDGDAPEAGLYIRYEFPVFEDHDFYVNYADGTEAAHVAGFNLTPVSIFDGTGSGGHSEQGAEQLDGLRTADCAGYTVDFSNYLGEGGEYTVTMWLGEIQNDPAPPAE